MKHRPSMRHRWATLALLVLATAVAADEPGANAPAGANTLAGADTHTGHDVPYDERATIGDVTFTGLRRTRPYIARRIAGTEAGRSLEPNAIDTIQQRLKESGLFSSVEVTVEQEQGGADHADHRNPAEARTVDINITVEERFTLFPVPVLFGGSGGFTGGLFVIDANFLGRNKQVVGGGFAGNDRYNLFGLYRDGAVFGSSWQLTVLGGTGNGLDEGRTVREELLWSADGTTVNGGLQVGYDFGKDLVVTGGFGLTTYLPEDVTVSDQFDGPNPDLVPGETYAYPTVTIGTNWDRMKEGDLFRYGFQMGAELEALIPVKSSIETSAVAGLTIDEHLFVDGDLQYSFEILRDNRTRVLVSGGYGERPIILQSGISGRDGYRTLPFGDISARSYSSGAVAHDLPLTSGTWGALVLTGFLEYGGYEAAGVPWTTFWGPGGGLRVYIRRVAVPALGVDVGYNVETGLFSFSAALGGPM